MNDATITIFHNPACGTSHNTLALIRNSGVEPVIDAAALERNRRVAS